MKLFNGWTLVEAAPIATLLAAGLWTAASGGGLEFRPSQQPDTQDLSTGNPKPKMRYHFVQADVDPLVTSLASVGITDFVCWINPSTGTLTVTTQVDTKPHLDMLPGMCPNNVHTSGDDDGDDDGGDDGGDGDGGDDGGGDGGGGNGGHDDAAHIHHGHSHFSTAMHSASTACVPNVPAGLLGNAFDVTQVDIGSVRLSMALPSFTQGGEIAPIDITFQDVGTPFEGTQCHCTSAGPDGELDIFMHFDLQQMTDVFGLNTIPSGTQVPLKATGLLLNGEAIFGTRDCIRVLHGD